MKKLLGIAVLGLMALAVQAGVIVVSWSSNGVLQASGMEPGSTGIVEAVSCMGDTFTNAASCSSDSNGMVNVTVPMSAASMFFRFRGIPIDTSLEGMVLIPAGTNSGTDPDFGAYSLTTDSFYMDATEVTKTQWDEVYKWAIANGYSFSNAGSGKGTNHPVHSVSWYDCVKWCNARSEINIKTPCYTVSNNTYKSGESTPDCDPNAGGYRLPTSDEWEYAARGGLSGKRCPWGDTITYSNANYDLHPDYYNGFNNFPNTSPAGSFAANGYGLYDMTGNVWEWCVDWYPGYEGSQRVLRGGVWFAQAYFQRIGHRGSSNPDYSSCDVGFRAVLPAK